MKFLLLSSFILLATICSAQNTFQRLYVPAEGDAETFGCYQLDDGGFIFTGILTEGTTSKVFMTRVNCEGNVAWSKTYNNSGTWGNISQRVIPLRHGGFCLAASVGTYNDYDILIVKTDNSGNTIWQKIMQGSGDDLVNGVTETLYGDIVVAGHTSSFGEDAGSNYCDVYVAKIDSDGNYLWGKSIGTESTIDEAFDIVATNQNDLVATGRYIEQGTFYSFILKMDESGNVDYLKAYGDTNQYSCGYDIIETANGDYAFTGATTIMKTDFSSYADEFIIRTNADGDTVWTRTYHGTNPDGSENASSIIEVNGGFVMGVATMSYPTIGFVPNKHVILKTDNQGTMNFVRSYNAGGSHYPYISKQKNAVGLLLSGFTTNYSPTTFKTIIMEIDGNYDSGCNQTDLLNETVMEYPAFQVREPDYVVADGGSLFNSNVSENIQWSDSVICENIIDSCGTIPDGIFENEIARNGKVYFNAGADEIVFENMQIEKGLVELYDYSGRLLLSQNNFNSISARGLTASVYFVVVKTAKSVKTFKIFVSNK